MPLVYYSFDNYNWNIWDYDNTITLQNIGDKVYLYGENESFSGPFYNAIYSRFEMTGLIEGSGDVTTLLTPNGTDTIPAFCFNCLFEGCESLVTSPDIPATSFGSHCCALMFNTCTSLKKSPSITANVTAVNCFYHMFENCSSLVDIAVSGDINEDNAYRWLNTVPEYGIIYGTGNIYGKPEKWVQMQSREIPFQYNNSGDNYVFAVNGDIPNNTTLGYIYDEDDESSSIAITYSQGWLEYDDEDWNTDYGTIEYHFNQLNNKQLWIRLDMNHLRATYFEQEFFPIVPQPTITGTDNTSQCWDGSTIHTGTGTVTITDPSPEALIKYSINNGEWIEYTFPIQLSTGEYTIKSYATQSGYNASRTVTYQLTVSEGEQCPPKHTYITTRINNILEDMVNDEYCDLASYQYEDKPTANVKLDNKKPSPTALFIQITDWKLSFDRMTVKEKAYVNISFLSKESKLDAGGIEQDVIIAEMKDLAVDFLQRLLEDKSLKILDDTIDMKSVFLRSDSNRTGVNISLEVEEKQGECIQ